MPPAATTAASSSAPVARAGSTLHVNGAEHVVPAAPEARLLYVLRNDLALNGPKFGCGLGECG
ncbi:MAG: hypothetical protein ABW210_02560, partial [Achromobacter sp.]